MCAHSVTNDSRFLHADSEDSDQTGRIPRLIRVFAGRTSILLVLSCTCSFYNGYKKENLIRITTFKETLFKTW